MYRAASGCLRFRRAAIFYDALHHLKSCGIALINKEDFCVHFTMDSIIRQEDKVGSSASDTRQILGKIAERLENIRGYDSINKNTNISKLQNKRIYSL